LLARDPQYLSRDIERLAGVLPDPSAVARLRQLKTAEVARVVISKWPQFPPFTRSKLIALLLERESWTAELAEAVKAARVSPAEISLEQRKRLPNIFVQATNRVEALQRYASVSSMRPNAERGAELFEKNCASCHAHRGRGFDVGPNLAEFAGKNADDFVLAIIDPNAAVDPKFVAYDVETRDGRSLFGVVKDETASSLTVVQAGGMKETVLRSAIEEIRASQLSLMPEGVEQTLSAQDMADLIGWIKGATVRPTLQAPGSK
jgi:putative heme-binding domain-containing protein